MRNKKVLVTGACGFIGSHLAEYLVLKGYDVVAFDKYNRDNHHGWLENSKLKKHINIILGDIRDLDSVEKAAVGCKTIFHLAALCGIPYSYFSPLAYLKTNVVGTYNILECAKKISCENTIITSTSEVYGTAQYIPIDEKHPIVGQSPYAASKIAADNLAISYFKSFKTPIKILRPFNTYGPRQSLRAVIPSIILQILSNSKKIKMGNLFPTRDFTYVSDTVNSFYQLSKSNKFLGEIVNFGTNSEISIKDLIKLISKNLGTGKKIQIETIRKRSKESEVNRLKCDNRKFFKILKTKKKKLIRLNEGVKLTIKFIKNNIQKYNNKEQNYNI